jgi:origin recognition complex subunit 3
MQFINQSHSNWSLSVETSGDVGLEDSEEDDFRSLLKCTPPQREIPTAAILAGVNMSDHSVLFERLKKEIVESVSPFVVYLESHKCNAGIKATMKEVLQQLMSAQEREDSEDDEELPKPAKRKKLPPCTMSLLRSWYKDAIEERDKSCPVVIIMDHFEGFTPAVLQEFITVISGSVYNMSFVLVIGIATSASIIHRSLTQGVSSLLQIQKFSVQSPLMTLDNIVGKILMCPDAVFSLGASCYKYLGEHFLLSSFSVAEFAKGLHFAMMEHFSWTAVSSLCVPRTRLSEEVNLLTHSQLDMLRALPSFRRYVEEQEPEVKLSLLEDDEFAKETVERMLSEFCGRRETLFAFIKIFVIFLQPLPTSALGTKLYQLLLHCSDVNLVDSDEFKTVWPYVRVLGEKQLEQCLMAVAKCIEDMDSPTEDVFDFKQQIVSFAEKLSKLQESQSADAEGTGDSKMATAVTTSERKLLLEEHLKQAVNKSKPKSVFTNLRGQIMDYLHDVFQEVFAPLASCPCYEVFCFEQAKWLKQHLNPPIRSAIQSALRHPEMYLPSCDSVSPNEPLSKNLPDISIVYHIHLECGKMINLYDWMQAFISIVAPEEENEDSKQVNADLHERFMKAVAELQFLGLVKQTKRKTDHVQRLTWGVC